MRQADASWEEIARAFPNRIPAALKAHTTHLKQRGSAHDPPAVTKGASGPARIREMLHSGHVFLRKWGESRIKFADESLIWPNEGLQTCRI